MTQEEMKEKLNQLIQMSISAITIMIRDDQDEDFAEFLNEHSAINVIKKR